MSHRPRWRSVTWAWCGQNMTTIAGPFAALVVTGILVAGCVDSRGGTPATDSEESQVTPGGLILPLDEFRYSDDGGRDVIHAVHRVIGACVQRFGAQYTLRSEFGYTPLSPSVRNEQRYGLIDPAAASAHGYNRLVVPGDESWDPSDEELILVRGTDGLPRPIDDNGNELPDQGCTGEAILALYDGDRHLAYPRQPATGGRDISPELREPELPLFEPPASIMATLSLLASEKDSRVVAVVDEWRQCMSLGGYHYTSVREPVQQEWPDPVTAEEIATASADVACKEETGLVELWQAVETEYQRAAIEERLVELEFLQRRVEVTEANAAKILDAG